jgi:hypothetical protein
MQHETKTAWLIYGGTRQITGLYAMPAAAVVDAHCLSCFSSHIA